MAAPPNTSPNAQQWEQRNQGFIPPSQLRQQNSTPNPNSDGYSGPPQGQYNNTNMSSDQLQSHGQSGSGGNGHTRAPSLFSSFRKDKNGKAGARPSGAGGAPNEFGNVRVFTIS
jgi:hypothetical protein